jgi:DNA-binding response OmpR family regulator
VLIIDDEPGIRFALKRWFERAQWTVAEVGEGHAALALLNADDGDPAATIDLIVLDLHLPGMSGEELIQYLRRSCPALVPRTILTTGDAVIDAEPGSVLAEHAHVLQKPFDLGTLKAAVERIVG